VATGSQSAAFIAKERRTRRKRPAPIAEGALTQRYGRVAQAGECSSEASAVSHDRPSVGLHGKHQRSSRERMLAAVLVGRPRLTALNADFAPEAVAYGLRAVRVSRP
jgi:hypothetical protein